MVIGGGSDPGFATGAWAIVKKDGTQYSLLDYDEVATKPKQPMQDRVDAHILALSAPIRRYHPQLFGIEDQSGVSTAARVQQRRAAESIARGGKPKGGLGFNANNDKTIGVSWLVMAVARVYGCPFEMFQPKAIKSSIIGKGGSNADKSQMIAMVKMLFPEIANEKLTEHEADAIATAVLACRTIQSRLALTAGGAKSGQVTT